MDARRQSDLQTEAQQPCVPTVRVKLVQAVKLDPRRSTVVKAHLVPDCVGETPVLVEGDPDLEKRTGLVFDDALVQPAKDGSVELLLTNVTAFPQVADSDADLGEATLVTPVEPGTLRGDEVEGPDDASLTAEELEATLREVSTALDSSGHPGPVTVRRVTTPGSVQERQQRLLQLLPKIQTLKPSQTDRLHNLITSNHGTFSLDKQRLTCYSSRWTLEMLNRRSFLHAGCPWQSETKWPVSSGRCRRQGWCNLQGVHGQVRSSG